MTETALEIYRILEQLEVVGNFKLCFELGKRTHRNLNEVCELPPGTTHTVFGDVGGHGYGGSPHL